MKTIVAEMAANSLVGVRVLEKLGIDYFVARSVHRCEDPDRAGNRRRRRLVALLRTVGQEKESDQIEAVFVAKISALAWRHRCSNVSGEIARGPSLPCSNEVRPEGG